MLDIFSGHLCSPKGFQKDFRTIWIYKRPVIGVVCTSRVGALNPCRHDCEVTMTWFCLRKPQKYNTFPIWLVVSNPPEKYESQIGSSSQLSGKIKNVPNHQPAIHSPNSGFPDEGWLNHLTINLSSVAGKKSACIWSLGFHTTSSLVCKSLLPQGCRWVPRSLSFSTPLRKWDALYNAIHTSMYKNHPTLNSAKQGVLGQLYHQQKWYASSDRIHVSLELRESLASSKHQLSSFTSPNHTKPVPFV